MTRTYYVWRNEDTQRVASGEVKRTPIKAETLRLAGARYAVGLGRGFHVICVSPCPTFPAAVHVLTMGVQRNAEPEVAS